MNILDYDKIIKDFASKRYVYFDNYSAEDLTQDFYLYLLENIDKVVDEQSVKLLIKECYNKKYNWQRNQPAEVYSECLEGIADGARTDTKGMNRDQLYRFEHQEELRQKYKDYYNKHKEYCKEKQRRYYQRKKLNKSEG